MLKATRKAYTRHVHLGVEEWIRIVRERRWKLKYGKMGKWRGER